MAGPDTASQVLEALWMSSQATARDLAELRRLRITHIVAVGVGTRAVFPEVFQYMVLDDVCDTENDLISHHFWPSVRFIEAAIAGGGRVLVHCGKGASRSAAIILAYLMYSQRLSLRDCFLRLRQCRPIANPNKGFWRQLQGFERELASPPAPQMTEKEEIR
eukprot:RCo030464